MFRVAAVALLLHGVACHQSFSATTQFDVKELAGTNHNEGKVNVGTTKYQWTKTTGTKCLEYSGDFSLDPVNVDKDKKRVCAGAAMCAAVEKIPGGCTNATMYVEDCKLCATAYGWKVFAVNTECSDKADFVDEKGKNCAMWKGQECRTAKTNDGYTEKGQQDLLSSCPLACSICSEDPLFKCQYMDLCQTTEVQLTIDLYQAEEVVQSGLPGVAFVPAGTASKVCPNRCSGHGICKPVEEGASMLTGYTKTCSCHQGWTGVDCSKEACPDDCSGHGHCERLTSPPVCKCDIGYMGKACNETTSLEEKAAMGQDKYDGQFRYENDQNKLTFQPGIGPGFKIVQPPKADPQAKAKADEQQFGAVAAGAASAAAH